MGERSLVVNTWDCVIGKRQTLPVGQEEERDGFDPLRGVYGHVEMPEACSSLQSLSPRIATDL